MIANCSECGEPLGKTRIKNKIILCASCAKVAISNIPREEAIRTRSGGCSRFMPKEDLLDTSGGDYMEKYNKSYSGDIPDKVII